ncbi:hypothetical protein NESM_000497200 [Novymonas esmeraldas]|uniref:SURP motif domain-containing protein n=1 Tax=Novymonas esmeraldas TaxID=1808958 RepID=A0AAW0ER98_9TRYP
MCPQHLSLSHKHTHTHTRIHPHACAQISQVTFVSIMSISLGTYPTTRQVGPVAPAAALRAAVERLQESDATPAGGVDARRPNYLLDVPVSAIDVDRWETRWREAATGTAAAAAAAAGGDGDGGRGLHFQHPSIAYAALVKREEAPSASPATASPSTRHLAPLPPFSFASVKTLPMTQLLKMRRQWLPHRQRFPVHQQRMGLLDAVLNHAVVALVGPAGSGRTLQVPIVLSETEVLKRRRLIVVSANAVAARLTALRLREERGEDVRTSRTVAAAVPNHSEVTESTSVVVTTAEVMLRQLLCDPCLEDVGCVVVDDAHLRSESTELCLSLLRDLLAVQQQWEQQQQQRGAAPSTTTTPPPPQGSAGAGPSSSPDAVRRRTLHVVLNCPDEACATALLSHMAPSRCTATTFTLQATPAVVTATTTLYLEEAVQWLLKCEREGSCLLGDGGAATEAALLSYAENVDAVARVMAAGDADFANPVAFRRYWLPLLQQCIEEFDRADRQEPAGTATTAATAPSPLSAIVVIAPNNHYVHVIANAVREAQRSAAAGDPAALRVCTALAEDAAFDSVLSAAQRTAVTDARQRWIIVATCELSQTVLPLGVDVGFVVDCARSGYTTVDAATVADTTVIEYSTIAQLRYRRRVAKMAVLATAAGGGATPPVVIQLIPKSVLHGAHHRRLSADPAQHIIFRLPFSRYVHVYHVLQAREEAALAQRAAFFSFSTPAASGGGGSPSTASKAGVLLSAQLIGVPAATATRYDAVRRIMTAVEAYLRAAGHLAVDRTPGSPAMGQLVLQPMAVLSLALPVPFPVARLLVAGSLLRPSLAALTAVAALWCNSDLLSLHGAGAVRAVDATEAAREAAEEQAALLMEARLFFSRDSASDVVSAFHVYQMWCTVKDRPEAERDFLDECGVAAAVLHAVFDTQVQLCLMLRTSGLLLMEPPSLSPPQVQHTQSGAAEAETALLVCMRAVRQRTADEVAQLAHALGNAMAALTPEVATSRVLHASITAALYPNCVVPTGTNGIGLLFDGTSAGGAAAAAAAAAAAQSATAGDAGAAAGVVGRRVASFSRDCVLADAAHGAAAAGRPFLFLAKAIADTAAREAAGVTSTASTVAATVVEQLDPLHEAAAMVFCGHSYERPRKAPTRCRGWSSVLTGRWRETRRARALPPVSQLPPTYITVQSYDTVHCNHVVCTVDQSFSLTMRATTARWLQQLRAHVETHLSALARGSAMTHDGGAPTEAAAALAAELAQAWEWWERRERHSRDWLREERLVASHQQQRAEDALAGVGGEGEEQQEEEERQRRAAASAARVASLRQRLFSYYEWQTRPGAPAAVVVPSNAERQAFAQSAAAAATATAAVTGGAGAANGGVGKDGGGGDAEDAEDEQDEAEQHAGAAQATYAGKVPPADIDHIFRLCVKSVAAKGTREAEAQLLRDNPDMFGFLDPEDAFHEYYLYLLRQAAPDMEVLGDNLDELITFLEGLETELRGELGLPDPSAATAAAAAAAAEAEGGGGGGGDGADGGYGAGMWGTGGSTEGRWGASAPFGGGAGYSVHDVPADDGEGDGYVDGEDGGLQLESATVNLKKSAGPTLAEKIEEARRAQASAGAAAGVDGAPPTAVHAAPALPMMQPQHQHPSAPVPFVSTTAGATLADKLRAMQMAAMGGGAVSASPPGQTVYGGGGGGDDKMPFGAAPGTSSTASAASDGVLLPPPSTADLLAAINGGSGGDGPEAAAATTAMLSTPHGEQPSQSFGLQQAPPTAEELMALLGPMAPAHAISPADGFTSLGVLGGILGNAPPLPLSSTSSPSPAAAATMAAMLLGMPATPLHRPPPALPAKAVEERPPSVLVYPVPDMRKYGNVRLLLARSLGESLNMRVGPTTIVGHVARIDVPNRNVEARALALKKFTCGETMTTVYLFKNDRVIDDPERQERERRKRRDEQRQEEAARHVERRRRTEAAGAATAAPGAAARQTRDHTGAPGSGGAAPLGAVLAASAGYDPTSPDAFNDPSAVGGNGNGNGTVGAEAATATPAGTAASPRFGVLASSSEDNDDTSSSASSADTSEYSSTP